MSIDIETLLKDPSKYAIIEAAGTIFLRNKEAEISDTVDDNDNPVDDPDAQLLFEDSMITLPNEEIYDLVLQGKAAW